MQRLPIIMLLLGLTASFGCSGNQTVKESWKYTKRQYYTYINTPATLDMEDKGSCEVYELALGDRVLDVDTRINQLHRAMENADSSPNQEWVMSMITRFPWLSGVALVDPQGGIEAKYPEYSMKEFTLGPILEEDPKQKMLDLRTYAQMSPLGAEVYVAKPVYLEGVLRGFVVVHFDPQQLVQSSRDASNAFIMLSPYGVLWNNGNVSSAEVIGADWAEILRHSSCGTIGSGEASYFWTTRYLGNMPIVYAVPTNAEPITLSAEALGREDASPDPAAAEPVAEPAASDTTLEEGAPQAVEE